MKFINCEFKAAIHHLGFFFGSISHNWFITFLKLKSIDFLVSFPKKKSSPVAWHNTPESQFFYQFFQTGFHEELTQGRKSVLSCAPPPPLRSGGTQRGEQGEGKKRGSATGARGGWLDKARRWERRRHPNSRTEPLGTCLARDRIGLSVLRREGRALWGSLRLGGGGNLGLGQERKGPLKEEGDEELGCVFCRGADLGVEGERPRMQVTGRALEWRPERERRTARRDGTPVEHK